MGAEIAQKPAAGERDRNIPTRSVASVAWWCRAGSTTTTEREVRRRKKTSFSLGVYLAGSPKAVEIASFDDQGDEPAGRLQLVLFAFSPENCLTGIDRFIDATRAADLS